MLFFDNIEPGSTLNAGTAPVQPSAITELCDESELVLATSIPLPDIDDSDISEGDERGSSLATYGESATTSVSEYDDDNDDDDPEEYEPARETLVPSGLPKTGVHREGGGARQPGMMFSSNMLTV